MRQLWQVHAPLSDFFKNLLVQRNAKINEKRNGVITSLWRLRLQENPDHKKVSSLYNTAVVTFFHISTHAYIVDVQTSEVSPLENPVEPPQKSLSIYFAAFPFPFFEALEYMFCYQFFVF